MRIIRPLLIGVACLVGLAFVLIGIAVTPPVQEWAARRMVQAYTSANAVVFDSASVGLSSLTFENLQLRRGGAVLAMPALRVTLPVVDALRGRTVNIEELSAKGWTLDLSGGSPAASSNRTAARPARASSSDVVSAEQAAGALRDWLKQLSISGSCKTVALEGDVLLPASGQPTALHVVLKGGELAPQKTAELSFDVTTEPLGRYPALRAQGPLKVTVEAKGNIEQFQFTGRAAPQGVRIPADLQVSAEASFAGANRPAGGAVHLVRGDHELIGVDARATPASGRLQGRWNVDLRDTDLAKLPAEMPVPVSAARGSGSFDAAADLSDVAVSGQLSATALPVALGAPNPGAVRALAADGTFGLRRTRGVTQIDQLECDVTGNAPIGHVRMHQPCRIDPSGKLTVADPSADWLEVTLQAFPLALLNRSSDPFRVLDTTAQGTVAVATGPDGIAIRSTTPVVAKNVALRGPKSLSLDGIDASVSFTATSGAQGWTTHLAPLALHANGRQLLMLDVTFRSVVDAYGRIPASGTWKADLDAWSALHGSGPGHGRAVVESSGEFTANVGPAADINAKFAFVGRDRTESISGAFSASIDDYSAFTLRAPVRITAGSGTAEFSIEGKWNASADAQRVDLQVSSSQVQLNAVQWLADLAAPEAPGAIAPGDAPAADATAFWAPLVGRIRFDIGQLATKEREFTDIGGTLALEPNTLELVGGRARFIPQPPKGARPRGDDVPLEPSSTYSLEGAIRFDATSPRPYQLKATGAVDVLTTQRLFGWTGEKPDAVVEGHWSVTDALRGSGANLADLLAHRQDELNLLSTGGTLRLLRTSVADAIPDEATPVGDTLATIGAAAGKIFGRRGNTIAGQRKLPPGTEAVLNFTYQTKEIGYEKLALTATRDRDGTLRLSQIEIVAPNEHLTGKGTIYYAPDRPFPARPLNLDLELAVRGVAAERLKTAGLLQSDKDAQGFTRLSQHVVIRGTLEQIDNREWHDLLATAAVPPKK